LKPEQVSNDPSIALVATGHVINTGVKVAEGIVDMYATYRKTAVALTLATTAGVQALIAYDQAPAIECPDPIGYELIDVSAMTNSIPDAVEAISDIMGVHGFERSWSSVLDHLNEDRGYTITMAGLEDANKLSGVMEYDDSGLIDTIDPGEVCIKVPAPTVYGFEFSQPGESLSDISERVTTGIELLQGYNPQLDSNYLTDPTLDLPTGTTLKVTDQYNILVVQRTSRGTLAEEAENTGSDLPTLADANYATFINGGAVNVGAEAYLPAIASPFSERFGIEPQAIAAYFDTNGAYVMSAPEAVEAALAEPPVIVEAEPTVEPAIDSSVTFEVATQMMPRTPTDVMQEMYPLIMSALEEEGLDDEQMELYTFATMNAEVPGGLPIPEYYGSTARYAPYYGRGYIQLTWQETYRAAGEALGIDLEGNPDLALEPENAARILAWYLDSREDRIRTQLNAGNLTEARVVVNGRRADGLPNGLEEFTSSWETGEALVSN